jgi:hypothetical protein
VFILRNLAAALATAIMAVALVGFIVGPEQMLDRVFVLPSAKQISFTEIASSSKRHRIIVCPAGHCGDEAIGNPRVYYRSVAELARQLRDIAQADPDTWLTGEWLVDGGVQLHFVHRSRFLRLPDVVVVQIYPGLMEPEPDGSNALEEPAATSSLAVYSDFPFGPSLLASDKARVARWLDALVSPQRSRRR